MEVCSESECLVKPENTILTDVRCAKYQSVTSPHVPVCLTSSHRLPANKRPVHVG